jgi:predicted DNA-binding protein
MCLARSGACEVPMKTQRVTLLVSPEDKRRFKSLADDRGLSVSEFVRQAIEAYNVSSISDTRELAALTTELRRAMPAMRKSVRDAVISTNRALASIEARRSAR